MRILMEVFRRSNSNVGFLGKYDDHASVFRIRRSMMSITYRSMNVEKLILDGFVPSKNMIWEVNTS